jgi:hypothetical protein
VVRHSISVVASCSDNDGHYGEPLASNDANRRCDADLPEMLINRTAAGPTYDGDREATCTLHTVRSFRAYAISMGVRFKGIT